jgi:hypothetical protein
MYEWEKYVGRGDEFNKEFLKSSEELKNALVLFEMLASRLPIGQDMESARTFSNELAEKRYKLICGVVGIFVDACIENMLQRPPQFLADDSSRNFEHYLTYFTAQEKTAQTGEKFVESVGFRMVENIDEDGEAQGDEMFGHLVLPIDFVYSVNSGEIEINSWLDMVQHDGVYLKYYYDNKLKNKLPIEFKITEDSVAVFEIKKSPDDAVRDMQSIFGTSENEEISLEEEVAKSNITEAKIVAGLLDKLAVMKLYKFKTQE